MKTIDYNGHSFVASQIVGISKTKPISTGSTACDWDLGFDVLLNGNTQDVLIPRTYMKEPKNQYEKRAENARAEFKALVNAI